MRISDYCRLLLKKYPHDENVKFIIALLKEMRPVQGILGSITIEGNAEWFKHERMFNVAGEMGYASFLGLVYFDILIRVRPHNYKLSELLCVLAHEIGHFLSLNSRQNPGARIQYMKELAVAHSMSQSPIFLYKEWEIIMTEEMIAWAHAKKLLKDIGYKDWEHFEMQRKRSLNSYEWHLYGKQLEKA